MMPLAQASATDSPRLFWFSRHRALYRGPYVATAQRCLGAWVVFVAPAGGLRVRIDDGDWVQTRVAVVPPHVRHQVVGLDRRTVSLHLEPESVAADALPDWMRATPGTVADTDAVADRVRTACAGPLTPADGGPLDDAAVDRLVFGRPLAPRDLDRRIATVLQGIDDDPALPDRAIDHARRCGLSTSRFVHLFKAETGVPFKVLRAWKRARAAIGRSDWDGSLAHLALESGYPDAAHFSRSMRTAYGLTPTGIRASARGLRRLSPPDL